MKSEHAGHSFAPTSREAHKNVLPKLSICTHIVGRSGEARRFKGRGNTAEVEVTAWEPPAVYAPGTPFAATFFGCRHQRSSPTETSTHLKLIATPQPRNVLARIAAIPTFKATEKADGEHLAAIKRALESA